MSGIQGQWRDPCLCAAFKTSGFAAAAVALSSCLLLSCAYVRQAPILWGTMSGVMALGAGIRFLAKGVSDDDLDMSVTDKPRILMSVSAGIIILTLMMWRLDNYDLNSKSMIYHNLGSLALILLVGVEAGLVIYVCGTIMLLNVPLYVQSVSAKVRSLRQSLMDKDAEDIKASVASHAPHVLIGCIGIVVAMGVLGVPQIRGAAAIVGTTLLCWRAAGYLPSTPGTALFRVAGPACAASGASLASFLLCMSGTSSLGGSAWVLADASLWSGVLSVLLLGVIGLAGGVIGSIGCGILSVVYRWNLERCSHGVDVVTETEQAPLA